MIKKLYESFAMGRISGGWFGTLLVGYEREQKTLSESITDVEFYSLPLSRT